MPPWGFARYLPVRAGGRDLNMNYHPNLAGIYKISPFCAPGEDLHRRLPAQPSLAPLYIPSLPPNDRRIEFPLPTWFTGNPYTIAVCSPFWTPFKCFLLLHLKVTDRFPSPPFLPSFLPQKDRLSSSGGFICSFIIVSCGPC